MVVKVQNNVIWLYVVLNSGRLRQETAVKVLIGIAEGCRQAGCALSGDYLLSFVAHYGIWTYYN